MVREASAASIATPTKPTEVPLENQTATNNVCDYGYFNDAFLDVFEIKDCTDELTGPTNSLHARLMFLPPAAPLVYGKWIDQGIGYAVTGGGEESYSDIIARDPWAAAPLVSFAVTCNPLPGLAVYGISKLF
jgi:hypothetical protein